MWGGYGAGRIAWCGVSSGGWGIIFGDAGGEGGCEGCGEEEEEEDGEEGHAGGHAYGGAADRRVNRGVVQSSCGK